MTDKNAMCFPDWDEAASVSEPELGGPLNPPARDLHHPTTDIAAQPDLTTRLNSRPAILVKSAMQL